MRTKLQNITPIVAALVVGITSIFAHNPNGKVDPMNAALEPLKGGEFEQSFLEQMIQHHRSAIEMSKMVSDHTKRPELRQLAEKITTSQQAEIDKMTAWLKDWYKVSPKEIANEAADKEMKMHMPMMSDKHDVDFDKAFLVMMPQHHHMAVEMAEQVEKKGTHPELKALAAQIAKDQQEEIKQMKSWAQSWFGPA